MQVEMDRGIDKAQAANYPPEGGGLVFDNSYFKNLQRKMGLFTSDQALFEDDLLTRKLVDKFASKQDAFFKAFVKSMIRMGNIIPSSMNVTSGAGMRTCSAKGAAPCQAYDGNVYGVRRGICSIAASYCITAPTTTASS